MITYSHSQTIESIALMSFDSENLESQEGDARNSGSSASRFLNYLLSLPRYHKRAILMSLDFTLLSIALWSSFSLRLGEFYVPQTTGLWALLLAAPAISIFSFHYNGLYKLITRFSGSQGAIKICVSMAGAVLIWCLAIYMASFTLSTIPRSVIVMFGVFSILLIWSARNFLAYMLISYIPHGLNKTDNQKVPVIIYGVGDLGTQLCGELVHSKNYKLVGFIDDDPSLWRQVFSGIRVNNPAHIEEMVKRLNVREIFLADPDLTRRRKRELLNKLAHYQISIKTLSSLHEIASGKALVSELRQIGLEDLLGREPVPPVQELLDKNVHGKSVMITGAGGSIGAELARQVVALKPKRLILFERSELALYEIEYELQNLKRDILARNLSEDNECFELISMLGSVMDEALVRNCISTYRPETIYHAAAYKHVPIVEDNPVAGMRNNVLGTYVSASAANDLGVELFVLISTDKAVRPTNVMGASKRIAELCLQAFANEPSTKTNFTMVRFGNVLGSSGSVVARFKDQITAGGPVTVTDPEIIRYFMMIPEAAQLVIQAGGLAMGGDVFVLDMGKPVKIVDLAKSMINLSGLEVADEENPDGDISIEFMGLRDGEKLYEELLINENSSQTKHPKIIRNHENFLPLNELEEKLRKLNIALDGFNVESVQELIFELVEGYQPDHSKGQMPDSDMPRTLDGIEANASREDTSPETATDEAQSPDEKQAPSAHSSLSANSL